MVEIDSSELLSLDELYLLRNLDEEKQKYEDMKEEIKENLKRQLRREKKINELEITVAELHKSRLEERKFSITKKITEFVRTDLDDCAEIKNILKKLAERQPKIQELKLKQKSLDEELKLIIESDEPSTVDQTKNLELSHAVLSIGTLPDKKSQSKMETLQESVTLLKVCDFVTFTNFIYKKYYLNHLKVDLANLRGELDGNLDAETPPR